MSRKDISFDVPLDRVIHERSRLMIMSYLVASSKKIVAFTELKEKLRMTAGNLSVQLRNPEKAGYVRIDKTIKNRKPVTNVELTPEGFKALRKYVEKMEGIINSIKQNTGEG